VATPKQAFCPHCGQRAPIRLEGIHAFCTACGGKRRPFETTTLNLAGKGWKYSGIAAVVIGSMAMVGGLAMSAFLYFLFGWLFPGTLAAYILSVPTLIVSLAFGITALVGGRQLGKYGAQKLEVARSDTVRALANHHGGALTAAQVASALDVTELHADAMLTAMAKDPDGDVTLDLDDQGRIHYLFGVGGQALREARWRVATPKPAANGSAQASDDGPTAEEIAEAEAELEAELRGEPLRRDERP
jgi:hypothetical protein